MSTQNKSGSQRQARRPIRWVLNYLTAAALGGILTVFVMAVYVLNQKQDLSVWHSEHLDQEFTTNSNVSSFADYLKLEERLFAQLNSAVYQDIKPEEKLLFNRYNQGSRSDPNTEPQNWNRTFEMAVDQPSAVAVLLHGLSDGPYSLRALADVLHKKNIHIVGLRIPGHGTAPSGLVHSTWQDMAAAVDITMDHAARIAGDKPVIVLGYSNGAALALNQTMNAIGNKSSRKADAIILFSPEIEITAAAFLAKWQGRIGEALGLHKLAWSSVLPEYDPYKYNSFAINAGDLPYRITIENQRLLNELVESGEIGSMPPILAYQSVVDATVSAPAVSDKLFDKLKPGHHELVWFDINRRAKLVGLFKNPPKVDDLFAGDGASHTIRLVTNVTSSSKAVEVRSKLEGRTDITRQPLGMDWPEDTYSLAHIAIPFAPDDPIYGGGSSVSAGKGGEHRDTTLLQLGNVALHGEQRVLSVPPDSLLRQHWNPFFNYLADNMVEFIDRVTAR